MKPKQSPMIVVKWNFKSHGWLLTIVLSLLVLDIHLPYASSRYTGGTYGIDNDDSFPSAMLLTIRTTDNTSIKIHLERNDNLHGVIPGYSIDHGNIKRMAVDPHLHLEAYVADDYSASFTMTCHWQGSSCQKIITGDFLYQGKDYAINPSFVALSSQPVHRIRKRSLSVDNSDAADEGDIVEVTTSLKKRRKRRAHKNNLKCIKIIVVSDYAIYKRFYQISKGSKLLFNQLYYRHLFQMINGVDVRYKRFRSGKLRLCIRLMSFFIAKSKSDSKWSTDNLSGGSLDATKVMTSFKDLYEDKLVHTTGGAIPHYDHAVLLTGYDVSHVGDKTHLGYGYLETMCNYWSLCIVEDRGNLMLSSWVMAHEIGHSLGAEHDGTSNNCGGHYIMTSDVSSQRLTVPWSTHYIFSVCSTRTIAKFVGSLVSMKQKNNKCLNCTKSPYGPDWDSYRNQLLGYMYHPDEQCQFINGRGSYLMREGLNGPDSICSTMTCFTPSNPMLHDYKLAYDGTPCYRSKACLDGQCKYNKKITVFDINCPYGEQSGIVFDALKLTCKNASQHYCTSNTYYHRCCESCKKFNSPPCEDTQYKGRPCINYRDQCNDRVVRRSCCKMCESLESCVDAFPLYENGRIRNCRTQAHRCKSKFIRTKCCATCSRNRGRRRRQRRQEIKRLEYLRLVPSDSGDSSDVATRYGETPNIQLTPSQRPRHLNDNPRVMPRGMP